MPSRPILQAWAKMVGPSQSICSLKRMLGPPLTTIRRQRGLADLQCGLWWGGTASDRALTWRGQQEREHQPSVHRHRLTRYRGALVNTAQWTYGPHPKHAEVKGWEAGPWPTRTMSRDSNKGLRRGTNGVPKTRTSFQT